MYLSFRGSVTGIIRQLFRVLSSILWASLSLTEHTATLTTGAPPCVYVPDWTLYRIPVSSCPGISAANGFKNASLSNDQSQRSYWFYNSGQCICSLVPIHPNCSHERSQGKNQLPVHSSSCLGSIINEYAAQDLNHDEQVHQPGSCCVMSGPAIPLRKILFMQSNTICMKVTDLLQWLELLPITSGNYTVGLTPLLVQHCSHLFQSFNRTATLLVVPNIS